MDDEELKAFLEAVNDTNHPDHEKTKADLLKSLLSQKNLNRPAPQQKQSGENSLLLKLRGQGFEVHENSHPGGPFSVILKRGKTQGNAIAPTFTEALEKAYDAFLLSLKKDP